MQVYIVHNLNSIFFLFFEIFFHSVKKSNTVGWIVFQLSETTAAVKDLDATKLTEVVYNETNSEKKSGKFCNNVTLPRSEVVFVAQMVVILIY